MKLDNHSLENKKIGIIPPIFYSDLTQQKFSSCAICDTNLFENNTLYLIEKSIKNYPEIKSSDTILEYAICWNCHEKLSETISDESKQKIFDFYDKSDGFKKRIYNELQFGVDVKNWIEYCCFSNIKIENSNEYNLIAMCINENIIYDIFPMAIDFKVIQEIHEQLSQQTKDEIDRFKRQITKLPPELDKLLKTRPIFI